MADPGQVAAAESEMIPEGPPKYTWFDGIVEGGRFDDAKLRTLSRSFNALGLATADLELDGGRFSILLADGSIPGQRMTAVLQEEFLRLLTDFVDHVPETVNVESTLRCTQVFEDRVVESLFGIVGRQMRCVSRVRSINDDDRRRDPSFAMPPKEDWQGISRGRIVFVAAVLFVGLGLLVWNQGIVDRLLAVDAAALAVEQGDFLQMLVVDVKDDWGNYVVEVGRGPGYPQTPEEGARLVGGALTPAGRAAVNAVANGQVVYVRLENGKGDVLAFARLELRALVVRADATVRAVLPGRISAESVVLGLDSGKRIP